jgi:hypothetical protein
MKMVLPKQHGAWAMLIIPFWLGVIAGGFVWEHIPLFLGWLLLYLATYPALLLFKKRKLELYTKWTLIYAVPGMIFLLIPFISQPSIIYFGLAMIPFFIVNMYYSSKKKDRAFLNDLSAIIIFSIGGLAASYLSAGEIHSSAMLIFIASILFFIGSTLFVKTMIRERKNKTYQYLSWIYHSLVPVSWAVLGHWVVAIAFLPSLLRAIYFYGKGMKMSQLGMMEVVNAVFFFIMMILAIV